MTPAAAKDLLVKGSALEFGKSSTSLAITDPEDYFTRIGVEENIFEVIHKRYDRISIRWMSP